MHSSHFIELCGCFLLSFWKLIFYYLVQCLWKDLQEKIKDQCNLKLSEPRDFGRKSLRPLDRGGSQRPQLLRFSWAGMLWNTGRRISSSLSPSSVWKFFHWSNIKMEKTSSLIPKTMLYLQKFRRRKNTEKNFRRRKLWICGIGKTMGLEAKRLRFLVLILPLK